MTKKADSSIFKKLRNFLDNDLKKINKPKILEFGVRNGISTYYFLKYINAKKLISVDINDCSKVIKHKNWLFIKSSDENIKLINSYLTAKLDVIYLDTVHTANHVEKIIYLYFSKLKKNGYFIIDDTFWLPYCKNQDLDKFWIEINNRETFDTICEIYNANKDRMHISFSIETSGICKIKKISNKKLLPKKKIFNRQYSIKNYIRTIIK
jgi:predicted O-methyltransferase YrrM